MLKIKVDQSKEFILKTEQGKWKLNDDFFTADVLKLTDRKYHALINNRSVTIELLKKDETGKSIDIMVNGVRQTIQVEDEFDQLLKQLGLDKLLSQKVNDIKAPMPGLVLAIKVKEGDAIKKGDSLLVLEAMKMENIIKAPVDAIIKKIAVAERTAVEKNQILMVME